MRLLKQAKFTGYGNSTQLINLLINWKRDFGNYEVALTTMITKIINESLRLEGYKPVRKEIEDDADMYQELTGLIYAKINDKVNFEEINEFLKDNSNISVLGIDNKLSYENKLRSLNKKLYNYFMVTLRFSIRNRLRKVNKLQSRAETESNLISRNFKNKDYHSIEDELDNPFPRLFNEKENLKERQVANMLSDGYTKVEIKRNLKISEKELRKVLLSIKSSLLNEL